MNARTLTFFGSDNLNTVSTTVEDPKQHLKGAFMYMEELFRPQNLIADIASIAMSDVVIITGE